MNHNVLVIFFVKYQRNFSVALGKPLIHIHFSCHHFLLLSFISFIRWNVQWNFVRFCARCFHRKRTWCKITFRVKIHSFVHAPYKSSSVSQCSFYRPHVTRQIVCGAAMLPRHNCFSVHSTSDVSVIHVPVCRVCCCCQTKWVRLVFWMPYLTEHQLSCI